MMRFEARIDTPDARQIDIQRLIDSTRPRTRPDAFEGVGRVREYIGKAAADRRAAIMWERSREAVKQQMKGE